MTKHLLLIAVVAAGCGSEPFTEYRNANTGERANLTLYASTSGLGDATYVTVFRAEEGQYNCATFATPLSLSGKTTTVRCQFAGVLSPIETLLDATCDQGGCSTSITGTELSVTGLVEGTFTLTVTARLKDGTVLVDSTKVTFVTIDAIALTCDRDYACPGPNAVFPGANFAWKAQPMSKGAIVTGKMVITAEPAGIVEITSAPENYSVRAIKPGVATLRLKSGAAERLQTIRVAAISDVVSGSVRLAAELSCAPVICVDADTQRLGDAAPDKITTLSPRFMLAWLLKDGTLAVGGAGRITSPTAGVEVLVAGRDQPSLPTDLELMDFKVGGTGGVLCHAGKIILSAAIETAKLDWTFEQTCP